MQLEPLEVRRLLASDWQNPFLPADVNDDGLVAPRDVLAMINKINTDGPGPLTNPRRPGDPFYDTTGDGLLAPSDVAAVINLINADRSAPVLSLGLANDTAPGGSHNDDGLTSNPVISGRAVDASGIASLTVSINGSPPVSVTPAKDGRFTFDPGLPRDGTADGTHTIQLAAGDPRGQSSSTEFQFTLDTLAPALVSAPEGTYRRTFLEFGVEFDSDVDGSLAETSSYVLTAESGPRAGQTIPIAALELRSDSVVTLILDDLLPDGDYHLANVPDAADAAGNPPPEALDVRFQVADPTGLAGVSPYEGQQHVRLDRDLIVRFDEPVEPATVNDASLYAMVGGERLDAGLHVAAGGLSARLSPRELLPPSTRIRLVIDGDRIQGTDGLPLDADGDNRPGGMRQLEFSTLSLTPIPGTSVSGFLYDSTQTNPDGSDIPIVGATLRVEGLPGLTATTDENGFFTLQDVPAPEFYVILDGSTATSAPAGFSYVSTTKPFHSVAGQAETLKKNGRPFHIYLPLFEVGDMTVIQPGEPTALGFSPSSLDLLEQVTPDVPREVWQQMQVEIPPDSLRHDDGSLATEIRIFPLDKHRIPAPLPDAADPKIVFSIDAGGADRFDIPARITYPNVDGLPPGSQRFIFSFDHAAGEWIPTGTMTVNAEGTLLASDQGVRTVGWRWIGKEPGARITALGQGLRDAAHIGLEGVRQKVRDTGQTARFLIEALPPGPRNALRDWIDSTEANLSEMIDRAQDFVEDVDLRETLDDAADHITRARMEVEQLMADYEEYLETKEGVDTAVDMVEDGEEIIRRAMEFRSFQTNSPFDPDRARKLWEMGDYVAAIDEFEGWIHDVPPGTIAVEVWKNETLQDVKQAAELLAYPVGCAIAAVPLLEVPPAAAFACVQAAYRVHFLVDDLRVGDFAVAGIAFAAETHLRMAADFWSLQQTAISAGNLLGDIGRHVKGFVNFREMKYGGQPQPAGWLSPQAAQEPDQSDLEAAFQGISADLTAMADAIRDFHASSRAILDLLEDPETNLDAPTVRAEIDAQFDILGAAHRHLSDPQTARLQNIYEPILPFVTATSNLLALTQRGTTEGLYLIEDLEDPAFAIRGRTNSEGVISAILGKGNYRITLLELATGRMGSVEFPVLLSGTPFIPTIPIQFPTDLTDSDSDGLLDPFEHVVGTRVDDPDTDADGLTDLAELLRGLDPLDDRGFPTGVVGHLALRGEAIEVVVVGSVDDPEQLTALVATGTHGLAIADVSQFDQPLVLAQLDLPGENTDVAYDAETRTAVVAGGSAGVHLVDVSDPLQPVIRVTVPTRSDIQRVEVSSGRVFAAGEGSDLIEVLDVARGESLQRVELNAPVIDLAVDGDWLYAITADSRLHVIEIRGFAAAVRGSVEVTDPRGRMPRRLFAGGGIAWLSMGEEVLIVDGPMAFPPTGYWTVDVSNPDAPALISGIDTPNVQAGNLKTTVNGSGLAVIAGGRRGVELHDASDPEDTFEFLTRIDTPGEAVSLALAAGIAFVADSEGGLQVVNYLPFDNQGQSPNLTLHTAHLDVAPGSPGIQVVEGSRISLGVSLQDDVQVRDVQLLVDGQVAVTDVSFPFDLSVPVPRISERTSLEVRVRATDTGGNQTLTSPIALQIVQDAIPPELISHTPANGATVAQGRRTVRLEFSEPMDPRTVTAAAIQLVAENDEALTPVEVLSRANDRVFEFVYEMAPGRLTLRWDETRLADAAGNALGTAVRESRFDVAAASVFWISPDDGFWDDAANWSTGLVPGPQDEVFLGTPGSVEVTLRGGTQDVRSLVALEPMRMTGGSLHVAQGLRLGADLMLDGGTLLGTHVTAFQLPGGPESAAGHTNGGLQFDGQNDLLRLPPEVLDGRDEVTISFWLQPQSSDPQTILSGANAGRANEFQLRLTSDTQLELWDRGQRLIWTVPPLTDGNFHHVALVRDASTAGWSLVLDGTSRGALSLNSTEPFVINEKGLLVGQRQRVLGGDFAPDEGLAGVLDELRVWTSARTLAEVQAEVAGTLPSAPAELAAHWTFDALVDDETLDLVANGVARLAEVPPALIVSGDTTLDDVTLNVDARVINNATVTIRNDLHSDETVVLNAGHLRLPGDQSLTGGGSVVLALSGGTVRSTAGGTLTVTPGFTVQGHQGTLGDNALPLVNQGRILANSPGGRFRVEGTSWINQGVLEASHGGLLDLQGSYASTGQIVLEGGTLDLRSDVSTADLGSIVGSGGAISIQRTLDNRNATLDLDAGNAAWKLSGGTILGGAVQGGQQSQGLQIAGTGILDAVTLAARVNVPAAVTLRVRNGLTLEGAVHLQSSVVGNNTRESILEFEGSQTLLGSGQVVFDGARSANVVRATDGAALTVGPGVTIRSGTQDGIVGQPNAALIVQGTVLATGRNISVNGSMVTNQGTLRAIASGTLTVSNLSESTGAVLGEDASTVRLNGDYRLLGTVDIHDARLTLDGDWDNDTTLQLDNATLELDGDFSTADLGLIARTASTIEVRGNVDNRGATFSLDAAEGDWDLSGGTILGGTVSGRAGSRLLVRGQPWLDGVTLDARTEVVAAATLRVRNGLTLDGAVHLQSSVINNNTRESILEFEGSQTLMGSGDIVFDGARSANVVRATNGAALTVGPGVTIRSGTQDGILGQPNAALIVQGTVLANGRNIAVNGSTVTNQGRFEATGSSAANLTVSNLVANSGLVRATDAGRVTLNGAYTNSGDIQADEATITLNGQWSSTGRIVGDQGTVNLNGTFTTADLGTIESTGGVVSLRGTLDNRLDTLSVDDVTGDIRLAGGTILGGMVAGSGASRLVATLDGGVLDGVTISGRLLLEESAEVTVVNGLTVTGEVLLDSGTGVVSGPTRLLFPGTQTLRGSGQVRLVGNQSDSIVTATGGGRLTVDAGIAIRLQGVGGTVGDPASGLLIRGEIESTTFGREVLVRGNLVTHEGTLRAMAGGVIDVHNLNPSAGTFQASVGSRIEIQGDLTLLATATVALDVGGLATTEFGRIQVSGTATLAGTLQMNFVTGFEPLVNESFEILTFSTASGLFDEFLTDGLPVGRTATTRSEADRILVQIENA